jgi:hypothetical protein
MKNHFVLLTLLAGSLFCACTKTETTTEFSNLPVGATTNLKTGTVTQQNAPGTPPTSGNLSVIQDSKGNQFLKLDANFTSGFATGTVAIYFAKTNGEIKAQRNGGTTAGNVLALGFVNKAGEKYIPLASAGLFSGFSYVVFYCETAEVNFGSAALN